MPGIKRKDVKDISLDYDVDEFTVPSRSKRKGGKRRTKTSVIPPLPEDDNGIVALPIALDDPILTIDIVDDYKRSDCRFYKDCLTHTAKSGWEQFHCNQCTIYEKNPEIDDEFAELAALLNREDPL